MSYRDLVEAEQRFLTLYYLLEDADRGASESILRRALAEHRHGKTPDEFRILADWLAKAGCVEIEDLDGVQILTLTALGASVARGETTVPGIAHRADVL